MQETGKNAALRKPPWLRVRVGQGRGFSRLREIISRLRLNTVCEEAMCPNLGECWQDGRATIMILGGRCTRGCLFCNVEKTQAPACEPDEPERVAEAVQAMGLKEIVLTSVSRDDLRDGGASAWAETIRAVRKSSPDVIIEILVPDFDGSRRALDLVLDAGPDIVGHNLETVDSLYATVRPKAGYARSLELLARAHESGFITKTGIMAGLGETNKEIYRLIRDARNAGCDIFFAGQYLRPSPEHYPVKRYVTPAEFKEYRQRALAEGFAVAVCAPLVRSSYHSREQDVFVKKIIERQAGA